MGVLIGSGLQVQLMSGDMDATELQTALGDSNKLGSFAMLMGDPAASQALLENPVSLTAIAGSALAMGIVAQNDRLTQYLVKIPQAIQKIMTTATAYNAYKNVAANKARLKNLVNRPGSKLKRQVFTADGTFTIPSVGLLDLSVLALGPGGGNVGSGGSGGGECVIWRPGTVPTSNFGVTIGLCGNPSSNTVVSALSITADFGLPDSGAGTGATGGSGGGADTLGGLASLSDSDILNAPFQITACTIKGGNGGNAGAAGSPGLTGAGGGAAGAPGAHGAAGAGFCSGGGGDGAGAAGTIYTGAANTGNGGGGSSGGTGGGGSGLVIVYYIENF